jgi:hypothetical protein
VRLVAAEHDDVARFELERLAGGDELERAVLTREVLARAGDVRLPRIRAPAGSSIRSSATPGSGSGKSA